MNRAAANRESRWPWVAAFAVSVAVHVGALALGSFGWMTPANVREGDAGEQPLQLGDIRVLPEESFEPGPASPPAEPIQPQTAEPIAPPAPIPATPEPIVAAVSSPAVSETAAAPAPGENSLPPMESTAPPAPVSAAAQPIAPAPVSANAGSARGEGMIRPKPLYTPEPVYPEAALRRRLTGEVTVQFVVTEEGAVSDVKVVSSSGHAALDEAAVKALREYKYTPARINGHVVSTNVLQTFPFVLR